MTELDIKRLNNLTDDLERRVNLLEVKKANKENIITIEERFENLLLKTANKTKNFYFSCEKVTFVVVNLEVLSPETFEAQFEFLVNGNVVQSGNLQLPISCEIPIKTKIGENVLTVSIKKPSSITSFKVDMYFSIMGEIIKSRKKTGIGVLFQNYVYFRDSDTIKCVNVDDMQTEVCYSGKDLVSVGYLNDNELYFLTKADGKAKIDKHMVGSNYSSLTRYIDANFTDCALEVCDGIIYVFMLRGDSVFVRIITTDNMNTLYKLPYKASGIKTFSGTTGRYLCLTDFRGTLTVIKHSSVERFIAEKAISLGRVENANLSEEDGKLMVVYKQGLVVVKKPVFESVEPIVVGIGDEGVITKQGITVIRKNQTLIKL
ncbi:MAG: hypothetical protein IKA99_02680 [Clostridia bacterium]|nr:hypothetical protein [Clostridia bacterium]